MRKLALFVAALVAAAGVPSAFAHNAGHIILPDGTCLEVGSNKEAPVVAEPAPGDLATGQLDLIPGPGDQYGARYAANQGNTPILPGNCRARVLLQGAAAGARAGAASCSPSWR